MTPWRLLIDPFPRRGAANMAVDAALLESAQHAALPTLRFYQWTPACLSFGRNQITEGVYDVVALRAGGIDVVRRLTGGLAVLHDRELTYSVTMPAALMGGPRAAYHAINAALVDGLNRIGVNAVLAGPDAQSPSPGAAHPCFQAPSAGEVMVGGGKLVGSAQRCEKRTILQHGSILLDGDQAVMHQYQQADPAATARDEVNEHDPASAELAGITLRSVLGAVPDAHALIAALVSGFESALGTRLAPGTLLEAERRRAKELESQYDSHAWTWRR